MKMKRFLAILLVLAMCLTTLGVVPAMAVEPAAEESDDAISARWTDKNSLSPADQEITPHEVEGEIPSADEVDLSNDENALKASDIVTVIVELESEPLADAAMGELDTFISSPACLQLEQDLLNEQASVRAEIEALTGKTETASVNGASDLTYSYTTVLNGFSMKLPYGKLDEVRSLNGVKNVWVAEQYSLPEDLSADDDTISMNSSTGMVGSTEVNAMGYDGTGTIVAILDTGFMKAHEAFSVMPTNTKYSKDDIASLLQSQSLASKVTDADSVYINEKAPYGYDYANGDADPEAIGQAHGVHVAGTVAGNNGKDFHGVAPNAQLMIMKIFGDNSGSTSDDIILAGIDDAVKLGADSINMSLGSPAGFTDYGDENESEEEHLTYYGVYTRAEKAGVNVLVAAGNETSSTMYVTAHSNLTYAEYPDNGIVASPSTVAASLSVASVDNVKFTSTYLMLGEEKIPYNNAVDNATSNPYDILETMDGKTLEYVMVPDLGEEKDFEGLDLTGKIAVVQRGTLNFGTKAENASKAGAVACIIYDNVSGSLLNAALETYFIPTITITKASGEKLAAAAEKKVSFSKEYYGLVDNPVGGGVSSFSSKGPAPDLSIKPEISAPGGNILSSVLGANNAYEVYSGTSMATPHMAGEAALLRQYLNKNYPNITGEDLGDLVNSLLMSTAVPSVEPDGTYYPIRRQGAGVANIANAIESGAYLSVEGSKRPKAEVGSSKDGVYTYTATVHNMTGEAKSYTVGTTAMIETIKVINGESFASNSNRDLTADEVTITYTGLADGNKITAPANGTATFSVKIELTEAGKRDYADNFPNGSYVEGYTFLTADEGVSLSLPILGFYGDWNSLQVFQGTYDEGPANVTYSVLADVNASLSGNYVGVNNRTDTFARRWMGFGPARGGRMLLHLSSLLRNSEAYQITVKNAKGETMWDSGDLGAVRKTYITVTQTGYQATATLVQKGWNGRLPGADGSYNAGDWAPEGEYTFSVRGRGVGSDVDDYQSYTFYVDNTKPELKSAELYEDENGDLKLALTVSDNKYLQFLWVIDSAQQFFYLEAAEEFKDMKEGETVRVVLDASDLVQQLSLKAANPGRVGIMLGDCANNTSTTFIDIGPQGMEIEPAEIAVGETKQLSYKVYPASMQDTAFTWTSSDESVATVNEKGEVTGLSDGTVRITATAFSRLSSYCTVTVGQGVKLDRNFGEAEHLGEIFTTEDGLWYKVSGPDTVVLLPENNKTQNYSGSYSSMAEIVVPAAVSYAGKTYRVTAIAAEAFYFNSKTTSITLPEGLETIGNAAFFFASGLTSLNLPDSIRSIGAMALNGVSKAPLTIPASVEFIGDSAFSGSGVVDGDLPEGLTYLGDKAFSNCTGLTSITLPSTVETYGPNIFYGCSNVTYVELPQNMEKIPNGLLWSCTSLKRIYIPSSVREIGNAAFYSSGIEKLNLPDGLEYIGKSAFAGDLDGETIHLPENLQYLGDTAFGTQMYTADYSSKYWVGPTTIYLNGSLSNIGARVFRPDAKVIAALNSQRNKVAGFTDLNELPTVIWDGKTDIGYNDGSCIPEGVTVTLRGNVTIDGKLCIEGKLIVPHDAKLTITKDAVILGEDNIVYEGCKHEHTREIVVEATCTESGSKTVVCEDCGETLSTEVIPAKGHSFGDWTVTKEATCFEDGEETRTCSVCQAVETRPIFANSDHCPSKAFSDLDADAWYHEGVDYALTNGLMNGVGGGKFEPDGQLTRAQLVTVLYRAAGEPDTGKQVNPFTDVADDAWYTKAVIWAANNGIVNGVAKNTFAPDDSITREQIATMLYRYAGAKAVKEDKLSAFPDAAKVSDWAKEALNWAVASGLINGVADANGTASLEPQSTATRAQIATILMRWLEK